MRTVASHTITRTPEHPGYDTLGTANTKGEDYLLHIDGHEVGGTYYCDATDIRDGEHWASWGPAGLSMGHRTREDAEQVQIDAHLAQPQPAATEPTTPATATPVRTDSPAAAPLTVTYDQALATAKQDSICKTNDPALMAAFCHGPLQIIVGAVSPRLVWEGAQKQGLTTTQLAALAYGNPNAVSNLQWL